MTDRIKMQTTLKPQIFIKLYMEIIKTAALINNNLTLLKKPIMPSFELLVALSTLSFKFNISEF